MRACLALLLCIAAAPALADCACPDRALSRRVLISIAESGLVACGSEDERESGSVVASDFQIFQCDGGPAVLEFDGTQSARLENQNGTLIVTELSRWPFGRAWEWIAVPVFEWRLRQGTEVTPKVVLPVPTVSKNDIHRTTAEYRRLLAGTEAPYAPDEEMVGRLFTAAISGDAEAAKLFARMPEDASLDGAAGEVYSAALATYEAWSSTRTRRRKD